MSKYNRLKAVEYASVWWNKRNPNYFNFDKLGGDCTNFVSQCLYHGGIEMNFAANGWFYSSLTSRAPAWTGVDEFFAFLTSNTAKNGIKGYETTIDKIEVGDVIQLNQRGEGFNHNVIVVSVGQKKTESEILIACHTNDAYNKRLSDYTYKRIRFLKII